MDLNSAPKVEYSNSHKLSVCDFDNRKIVNLRIYMGFDFKIVQRATFHPDSC